MEVPPDQNEAGGTLPHHCRNSGRAFWPAHAVPHAARQPPVGLCHFVNLPLVFFVPSVQRQLLHPPIQQLRDVQFPLRRARHRVDPAELFRLLP